jgi:hypothetical protein
VRVLWLRAPLLLRRHPPVLAAVVLTATLAAIAGASYPLVRAGVESESLQGQLEQLTPLAAGFEVYADNGPIAGDAARRAAAAKVGRTVPQLAPVVASTLIPSSALIADTGSRVIPIARTGAFQHVRRLRSIGGPGVWISQSVVQDTGLQPGDTLRLTAPFGSFRGRTGSVRLRISGVYLTLEVDRDNPYWANWQQDIRTTSPDLPPPPPFVLMSNADLARVARVVDPFVQNRFEYPVDPRGLSFTGAHRLERRLEALGAALTQPGSRLGPGLNCHPGNCTTSSSLSSVLAIAASDVAAVSPTLSLLSGIGLVIAFALAVASGLFLVRRRADEAHVTFVRGEAPLSFAARTALEAALPAAIGFVLGSSVALLALESFAPTGTITGEEVSSALIRAALAATATIVCVAAGSAAGYPRRAGRSRSRFAFLARVPWEAPTLVVAALLLALLLGGHGVASDANGAAHPRLTVFLFPVLVVAGSAGLAVRLGRRLLRRSGAPHNPSAFLALRRLGAARGLLVAVVVAAATAFGTFAYASTLSASLDRSVDEKAFVANGSDVQALVDPATRIISPLGFPAAIVEVDQSNVAFPSGDRVDVIAGDPASLGRTLRWGSNREDDPRRLLPRLGLAEGRLAAIATPGTPDASEIVVQGVRVPITVVGYAAVPGATAGRPALLVSRPALRTLARRLHFVDPGPLTSGLLWAKGPPARIEPAIDASNLGAAYVTRLGHLRSIASVAAAERSYRYVRLIGLAAAILALVALLLYLQARQRAQLIASALVRRMGFGIAGDAAALAFEAAAIVLVAAVVGAAAALLAARPVVHRVDSLPQYAPSPVLTVPWLVLAVATLAAVASAALIGVVAVAIASRSDAAEALRVA